MARTPFISCFKRLANIRWLVLGVLLCSSLGCRAEPEALRVGLNPWPGYEPIYLAQKLGYFRDAGVEVRLVEFASLADARRAFERRQIDALAATIVEVLQARAQSPRELRIVQVLDYSNGADMIVARAGVTEVASLRGARIGVELASVGVYLLARALEQSGLSLADVTVVSSDQLSLAKAFQDGSIDATVTYPPVSVELLQQPGAVKLFTSAQTPHEVLDVIAADQTVISTRASDFRGFLKALHRALRFVQAEPQRAYALMAKHEQISASEFERAFSREIGVVGESEQSRYLAQAGSLRETLRRCDQVLHAVGSVVGDTRYESAITAEFLPGVSTP